MLTIPEWLRDAALVLAVIGVACWFAVDLRTGIKTAGSHFESSYLR